MIPRKIAGREMRTIVLSMEAIRTPMVVLLRATHLYSTTLLHMVELFKA